MVKIQVFWWFGAHGPGLKTPQERRGKEAAERHEAPQVLKGESAVVRCGEYVMNIWSVYGEYIVNIRNIYS